MNIICTDYDRSVTLRSYLETDQIAYQFLDLWNPETLAFAMPSDLVCQRQTLLVITPQMLTTLLAEPSTKTQLLMYLEQNILWIWKDRDGLMDALVLFEILEPFDAEVPHNKISWFIDGKIVENSKLKSLRNIRFIELPYNWFLNYSRVPSSIEIKYGNVKDFMITMIKKPNRPHREILWQYLSSRSGLLDLGHCRYGSKDSWIGQTPPSGTWPDGWPSRDLYQTSWLELVPETLCCEGYFITEKTVKPLVTKTPFLIMSTCGYLNYLKSFGFKTFDSVIDESYDLEPDLDRRAAMIIDQLAHIIAKGTENFYHQCRNIVDHNHKVLMEISGKKNYVIDQFLSANLAQIDLP